MPTETKSYTVIIERDPETNWLIAEVVELPGCYTQARDLPSLEENIREAITSHLAVLTERDDGPGFVGTWRVEVSA